MPANGRSPFTAEDDNLLAKYLAKYAPGIQGRSGNKIYKLLVENEHKKWSWSSHHSWESWRNRYTKNQDDFNRRIKAYQIKKGLPTENSQWVNGTQKLKGSDVEDEEPAGEAKLKRKRESSVDARKRPKVASRHETEEEEPEVKEEDAAESDFENAPEPAPAPARRRTHVPDIYPDIAVLDEPRDNPPNRTPHKQAPPRSAPKPKPTLSARHDPDSDFFQSVPPTPTTTTDAPSRPPTTASAPSVTSNTSVHEPEPEPAPSPKPKPRGLPRLFDGAFRTVFQGVRQWAGGDPKSDDDSPQKEWPPRRVRKEGPSSGNAGDSMEVEQQNDGARKQKTVTRSKNGPKEQAGNGIEVEEPNGIVPTENDPDEMEIEQRSDNAPRQKTTPSAPLPARRSPQQVNAVASSSRVRLLASSPRRTQPTASPERRSQPTRTPPFQRSQAPQPSTRRRSPMQSSHRHRQDPQRSPSPLDWGSNPSSPLTKRTPATSPSKPRGAPPRQSNPPPFDSDRHSRSKRDLGSNPRENTSRVLPRLFFTENGSHNSGGSLRNRDRSIGSVEHGSLARRARAEPGPRLDLDALRPQYRLPSPPRASSSRPSSGTPLATKAKRHPSQAAASSLPFGFKPLPQHQQPADEPRRHSFPAALPRVDFYSMSASTSPASVTAHAHAPRQSLPPRAPPHRAPPPPPPRRHSLFTPPAPPPASTSVSPNAMPFSISATDRPLIEQLGVQALMAMAQNHGFSIEVVRNLSARTGDLKKTDEILLRMRQTAEAAAEAALRGGDEVLSVSFVPEEAASYTRHHRRPHSAPRTPIEPPEEPFVLHHRRQHSGASATLTRSPPSAPSSSQRKKRHQQPEEDAFPPQPLVRDVLADMEYTPPSTSRAGALTRAKKKGRMEEGLQQERERATIGAGETLSGVARGQGQGQGQRRRLDMEDDVVRRGMTPELAASVRGNERVLRELQARDETSAILGTGDFARFMIESSSR